MKKAIYPLAGLLALQALFLAFLTNRDARLASHAGIERLLDLNRSEIDGLRIRDAAGESIALKRSGDDWYTAAEDFPVNSARLESLIHELETLEHGLSVSDTVESAKQLKVSEDDYERVIEILQDGNVLHKFYVGTGAGARRTHVRKAGESSIHTVSLTAFNLFTGAAYWQDKTVFDIAIEEVRSVKTGDLLVEQDTDASETAPAWTLPGLAENETFDADAFQLNLNELLQLRFNRAFKGKLKDWVQSEIPVSEFRLGLEEGERIYRFYEPKADNAEAKRENFLVYTVSGSGRDELVYALRVRVNRIREGLSRANLVKTTESAEAQGK